MLLVSSLSVHSRNAYALIQNAHRPGTGRPLIIAGGPKAIYEPYDFWLSAEGKTRPAPDIAVTGEVYVLLELLNVLLQHRARRETLRVAFERAAREGSLESIPGLVYRDPFSSPDQPRWLTQGCNDWSATSTSCPARSRLSAFWNHPIEGGDCATARCPVRKLANV